MAVPSYVLKVSRGRIPIPAGAQDRWNADRVVAVDLGDRVVIRPLPEDPVEDLQGRYQDRGPTADKARRAARAEERRAERDHG